MKNTTQTLCAAVAAAFLAAMIPAVGHAAAETAGFIHGTVTTSSGNTYTGVMRWGTEEAFWDDVFHSS